MPSMGKLIVDLAADTAKFDQGMTRSAHQMGRQMDRMKQHVNSFSKTFGRVNLVAQAAFAGINTLSVVRLGKETDDLSKMARRLGVDVKEFTKYQSVVEMAGIEMDLFGTIMQRVIRRSAEAAKGSGEAVKAFREMGIDAKKFSELDFSGKVFALAETYKDFGEGDFLRLIQKIGDTEATALGQLFAGGRDAIAQGLVDAESRGDYVTEDMAKTTEKANDNLTKLESRFRGFTNSLLEQASGGINDLFDMVGSIGDNVPDLPELYKSFRAFDAGLKSNILSFMGFDEAAAAADRLQEKFLPVNQELKKLESKAIDTAKAVESVFDPDIKNTFSLEEKVKKDAESLKLLTSFARAFVLPDLQDQATESEFSGVGREIDRARTYLGPSAVTGNQQSAAQRQLERATELLERIEYNTKRNELAEAGVLL